VGDGKQSHRDMVRLMLADATRGPKQLLEKMDLLSSWNEK